MPATPAAQVETHVQARGTHAAKEPTDESTCLKAPETHKSQFLSCFDAELFAAAAGSPVPVLQEDCQPYNGCTAEVARSRSQAKVDIPAACIKESCRHDGTHSAHHFLVLVTQHASNSSPEWKHLQRPPRILDHGRTVHTDHQAFPVPLGRHIPMSGLTLLKRPNNSD